MKAGVCLGGFANVSLDRLAMPFLSYRCASASMVKVKEDPGGRWVWKLYSADGVNVGLFDGFAWTR